MPKGLNEPIRAASPTTSVAAALHWCGELTLLVAGIWLLYEGAVDQGQNSTLLQELHRKNINICSLAFWLKITFDSKLNSFSEIYLCYRAGGVLTLRRCSFPPELRVQTRKCLVKRKHCLSPSFFREREPRRTLLSFPRSTDGSWIREPEEQDGHRITLHFIKLTQSRGLCLLSGLKSNTA